MNTQIIANVNANIIQNNEGIYSQILKYLYLQNTRLPSPDKHVIITPFGDWSKTGHISGEAISYLNFADNSIIFLSELNEGEDIITPSKNTSIKINGYTNSSNESFIDNQIIDDIYNKIDNVQTNDKIFMENPSYLSNIPIVIEAARIRKRGTPFCTPIFIGKKINSQKLSLFLKDLIKKNGKSVIINSQSLQYKIGGYGEKYLDSIVNSFLPEASFNLLNDASFLLLEYLAHYFKTPIHQISKGRYNLKDDVFEQKAFGLSKNKTYYDFNIYDINNRKKIWRVLINSITNKEPILLDYEGCSCICINDINENKTFYSKIEFKKGQDLGTSIYNAAVNLLDNAPVENLEKYFIEIKCIIDLENLSNYKLFSRKNQSEYNIIGINKDNLVYIPVLNSISKTIQNFSLDINSLYLCKELSISLPLNIILNFCEINYP